MKLTKKIAIITGAGSGIGRASAILFAKEGAKVVVADINDNGSAETAATIKSGGGEAVFVHTDVSIASETENLIKVTKERFGKIDILFNNAGIPQKPTSIEDLDESLWDHIYGVNVKGIFLMTKYAVPMMKEARSGVIINLASLGAIRPRVGQNAYASSKGAAIVLTKALALELAPWNIRVNCINPGVMDTSFLAQFVSPEHLKEDAEKSMPLGRLIRPEEIAYTALYLASDESAMVTGACINVDGGRAI